MSNKVLDIIEALLSPGPLGLAIGILLVLTLPIFIHFFVHRASSVAVLPSILLVGPSESGKTSLLTLVSFLEA
jgi:signal recognition particle receptor subunit beta